MPEPSTRRTVRPAAHPSRLWLLALAVLLPGLILAGLGLRGVWQEQRAARDEERDRLDRLADRGVRTLESELRRWQNVAADLAAASDAGREDTLRRLAQGLPSPGAGPVLLVPDTRGVRALPRGSLMYAPESYELAPPSPAVPAALAAADDLEIRSGDKKGALLAYQRLLPSAPVALRPAILSRLGRTYAAVGQFDAALRVYAELETQTDGWTGPLPASLVGTYERCRLLRAAGSRGAGDEGHRPEATNCAIRLYEGLVAGRWPIEKARFEHFISEARTWLSADPRAAAELDRLQAREANARIVAEEADAGLTVWRTAGGSRTDRRVHEEAGRAWLSLRTPGSATGGGAPILLLPSAFLSGAVWRQAFSSLAAEDADLALVAPGGIIAYRTAGDTARAAGLVGGPAESSRTLRDGDLVWQVHARARGAGRLAATLATRQQIYVATLVLMVASLLVGALLIARTVRREMEISRLKSQFVSAVSHEFRSPLASIRQLAELLDRGVPSPDRSRQYYKVILDESERLSRLVERVLDFSRMEEGRQEYMMAPIDTTPWLTTVAADATHALGGKRLETSIPADLPSIVGDGEALATAVHNLVDNAAKYSPGCDTVWVSAAALPDAIAITVRDRGIGISPEDRPHLFDRFYRGAATANVVKGTGLGLSLVRHIIDAHHGRVDIESATGEGTTVTLEIPS